MGPWDDVHLPLPGAADRVRLLRVEDGELPEGSLLRDALVVIAFDDHRLRKIYDADRLADTFQDRAAEAEAAIEGADPSAAYHEITGFLEQGVLTAESGELLTRVEAALAASVTGEGGPGEAAILAALAAVLIHARLAELTLNA